MWLPSLAATDSSFQTSGTTITAHATIHTKGSWVELVASTPFDVTLLGITSANVIASSGTNSGQLTDIGVGANPNEKVLIANIPTGYGSLRWPDKGLVAWFPVEIPAGTRISARVQAVITVDTNDVQLFMFGGSSWSSVPAFQSIDTMGADTGTSLGTPLSTSITEIIASTAHDYKALGFGVDGGGDLSLGGDPLLSILVGAGAAEKNLIETIKISTNAGEAIDFTSPSQGIIPIEMNIPAGSRLSAKLDGGSAFIGLVLYGFR